MSAGRSLTLADAPLADGEIVRVSHDGKNAFVRRFFTDDSGALRPGKDGLRIPRRAVEAVRDGLTAALEVMHEPS